MKKKGNNFINIFEEPKEDERFVINIYLDKEHKFTDLYSPKTKIEDLKKEILLKLSIYSINYKMEYNDHDIGGFDDFTLQQIFLNKKKEEYDIYLTLISTLKKFEGQRVLMTFIQGQDEVILYKILSMKWLKVKPQFSSRLHFGKFPYNARSCHIMQSNQLIITGGIDNEKMACYYDADTNNVIDLPDMNNERQRHTMISIGDNKVFIIGGAGSNKVTLLDVEYECYEEYPSMKYTRKDASVAFVNERYLYVFMGLCDELRGVADNFEKLDIKEDGGQWKILPINNFVGYKMPRTYCGCAYIKEESCFYFFGGSFNSTAQGTVMKLTEDKYEVTKSRYTLPFNCVFDETCFLRPNELTCDYYLFTFKEHQLIHFNCKSEKLEEIPQEWLD
jgi:hypothetical protein